MSHQLFPYRHNIILVCMIMCGLFLSMLNDTYAVTKHEQFDEPCLGQKCPECGIEIYRLNSKGNDALDIENWNVRVSYLHGLIEIRSVMIQDTTILAQESIDKAIFEKVKILLSHRYNNSIVNDYFNAQSLSDIREFKVSFEAFPLLVSEKDQVELSKLYDMNGL
ncbi:hypothetical protein [Shewanella donghaensis]|uniref:hypothetical protein n=1 Tax=Shewanella donghaensis TaxID=238836 RepID=UPI0011843644|nr:hypothetical protein [Shewanella donghaensis]